MASVSQVLLRRARFVMLSKSKVKGKSVCTGEPGNACAKQKKELYNQLLWGACMVILKSWQVSLLAGCCTAGRNLKLF